MGGGSSKGGSWRQASSLRSNSSSRSGYQFPYESQSYSPQQSYSSQQYHPPSQEYGSQDYGGGQASNNSSNQESRFSRIADNYNSLEQVDHTMNYHLFNNIIFIFPIDMDLLILGYAQCHAEIGLWIQALISLFLIYEA